VIRLALYQPEIPQNTGTMLRMATCLGIGVDIIEPCGFILNDAKLRRAGMDYIERSNLITYNDLQAYKGHTESSKRRVVLLTPHTQNSYYDFQFQPMDTLMMGRESDGFPFEVTAHYTDHICIPMQSGERSLNVAIAASMVIGEALRQLKYEG